MSAAAVLPRRARTESRRAFGRAAGTDLPRAVHGAPRRLDRQRRAAVDRDGLHFSTTGLQWVVNAYTITFAGFLMLGGRAADLIGRRRMFFAGTALFSIASLLCAFASSRGLLIAARSLQGIGGAVLSPASLAIITTSFSEGAERNRALGVWGAMAGWAPPRVRCSGESSRRRLAGRRSS